MKQFTLLFLFVSILSSCKKDEELKSFPPPASVPSEPSSIPFSRYEGVFITVDGCPADHIIDSLTQSIYSFYVRNTGDTLLETYCTDASPLSDIAVNYEKVIPGTMFQFELQTQPHHSYYSCTIDGDSIHTVLSVFNCVMGSDCDIWTDHYYFDGVKVD